jgi:hypothetical protein
LEEKKPMNDQTKPDFAAFPNLAVKVITNPVGFYREMAKTGGFVEPLVFVVIMALIAGVVVALLSLFGLGMAGMPFSGSGFVAVIAMPIGALIGSFIGAAILYVIWLVLGSKESFETAYRCIAFATAIYPITALLSAVPYLGTIVSVAWGFYLMAVASIEVHKIKTNIAYLVFGILGVIVIALQVGGEYSARKFNSRMQDFSEKFQNMTPGEMGKALGEFQKEYEKAAEEKKKETE